MSFLDPDLHALFKNNAATREYALTEILDLFAHRSIFVTHMGFPKFLETNYITLLSGCLACIKSPQSTEVPILASRVIGLLTITMGEKADDMLDFGVHGLFQALKPGDDPLVLSSVFYALAILTVVTGDGIDDTERSMQVIWKFLHENLAVADEGNTEAMISAISAWSFLLSSMERFTISCKLWKGSISYFRDLLLAPNGSLRIVAGEALAHILEIDAIEKFSYGNDPGCNEDFIPEEEGCARLEKFQQIKRLILDQVKTAVTEASDMYDVNATRNTVKFLKSGCQPKTTIMIRQDQLVISSWAKLIQVEFFMQFLGSSFDEQIQKNEVFTKLFHFTLKKYHQQAPELYLPTEEKSIRYVFQPELINKYSEKRLFYSTNSRYNKAKTEILNKRREARNVCKYSIGAEE